MSDDHLIDKLRREGRLVAEGGFGIDHAEARRKLREYRLADAHHYVLDLVQGAYLLGAPSIDIELDADEMSMRFGGESLSAGELGGIYDAFFSERADERTRALRWFALGLHAAEELDLAECRFEVVAAGQRTTIDFLGDERAEPTVEPTSQPDGHRIYIRQRKRMAHAVGFVKGLRGTLPEQRALRQRCALSDVDVSVNGERVNRGVEERLEPIHEVRVDAPQERARVELFSVGEEVQVFVVQHGVTIVEKSLPAEFLDARVIVETERLSRDLSQRDFVENETWDIFWSDVVPQLICVALDDFVQRLDKPQMLELRPRLYGWLETLQQEVDADRPAALQALERPADLDELHRVSARPTSWRVPAEPASCRVDDLTAAADRLAGRLARSIPAWEVLYPRWEPERSSPEPSAWYASLGELEQLAAEPERTRIFYTRGPIFDPIWPVEFPVLRLDDPGADRLASLCDCDFVDVTPSSAPAEAADAGELERLAAPFDLEPFPQRRIIQTPALSATLAHVSSYEAFHQIEFVRDGNAWSPVSGSDGSRLPLRMRLEIAGEIPVDGESRLTPEGPYLELVARLLLALPEFILSERAHFRPLELEIFLQHLLDGELWRQLLADLHVEAYESWILGRLTSRGETPWTLGAVPGGHNAAHESPSLDELDETLRLLGTLRQAALFSTCAGPNASLASLRDDLETHGELWVADELDTEGWRRVHLTTGRQALYPTDRERDILQRLFGEEVFASPDPRATLAGTF